MNPFVCVLDLNGRPLGTEALASAIPGLVGGHGRIGAVLHGCWAGAWVPSTLGRPIVAHRQDLVAVGDVRLSNRRELIAQSSEPDRSWTDLELVIDRYLRRGKSAVRDLIGDFAFVLWDTRQRTAFAARDALGVKRIFYQRRGDRLVIGSDVECFELGEYDREYFGSFLIGFPSATTRTAFRDITRLGAGSTLTASAGRVVIERYWDATEFVPVFTNIDERRAKEEFRQLFEEAVAAQLEPGVDTWAQLSGGLDSSSNVAMAAQLAQTGKAASLGGTVTIVDSLGEGDETRYSDAVLERYPHKNERIADYWAWQADEEGLPATADPHPFYPFYARDRALYGTLRRGGAQAVLSGFGSDHYLTGLPVYIADLVARGELKRAAGHTIDLAIAARRSFWQIGFRHGIYPLLPRTLRRKWSNQDFAVPAWIGPAAFDGRDLDAESMRLDLPPTGAGRFANQVAAEVGCLDMAIEPQLLRDEVEVRYPFMHRPLVEFSLRLPPTMRAAPGRQKWILREALADLLPDRVRNRPSKGGIDARMMWSLTKERSTIDRLVRWSRLADLGLVDHQRLAAEVELARTGNTPSVGLLFVTLALETWLAARERVAGFQFGRRVSFQTHAAERLEKESSHEAAVH